MPLLDLLGLSVHYDGITAVRDVSLSVETGEVVVLIGANGAGKSSVVRALFGLVQGTAQKMSLGDIDISRIGTRERIQLGMSLVPETKALFSAMSVADNLKLGLFIRRSESQFTSHLERICEIFPILKDRLGQQAGTLSGGEQQMLALARALMQQPQVLCLDEPSLGLAPKLVDELYTRLDRIRAEGVSILLIEQQARRALAFGNRGYVLHVGEVATSGPCSKLVDDEYVRGAYLGRASA
jgi:branched-chain amino acid transport system ATP-binding protein